MCLLVFTFMTFVLMVNSVNFFFLAELPCLDHWNLQKYLTSSGNIDICDYNCYVVIEGMAKKNEINRGF